MNILDIIISLFITIIVYLFYPLIRRFTSGKVGPKQARKISLINSIVCSIIFSIIRAFSTGGAAIISSFAPAILYYFIAKLILTDKSINEDLKIENDDIIKENYKAEEDINKKFEPENYNDKVDEKNQTKKNAPLIENEIVCNYECVETEEDENNSTAEVNNINLKDNDKTYKDFTSENNDSMKICPACGKENDCENSFCIFCGNKIATEKQENQNDLSLIKTTSSVNDLKNKIKNFQKLIIIFSSLIISILIIDPIICSIVYPTIKPRVPSLYEAKEVRLSDLSIYDDTYYELIDNVNYIYQESNGIIKLYKFENFSRYSYKDTEHTGCATITEIKNYFKTNLKYGKPSFSFWSLTGGYIIFGLFICLCFLAFIILFIFSNKRMINDLIRILLVKSESLKKWKEQFDRCELSYNEYSKMRKDLISRNILENSDFENKVFRFLY